jgi:hypothetical protein
MRGVTYDYEFEKPDKTKLTFNGQSMSKMLANIRELTTQHYGLDFKVSRDTIYNVMHRLSVAHKFYATKLVVKKNDKPKLVEQSNQDAQVLTDISTHINAIVPNS